MYEAGDAVGIYPTNRTEDVEWVIQASRLSGDDMCSIPSSAYQPQPGKKRLQELDFVVVYFDIIFLLRKKSMCSDMYQ